MVGHEEAFGPHDTFDLHELGKVVKLNMFDSDIKDGASNAIYGYEYGDQVGEVFHSTHNASYYEIYPHDGTDEPLVFVNQDNATNEDTFIKEAILKTYEIKKRN